MSDPYSWLDNAPAAGGQPEAQPVDDPYAWLDAKKPAQGGGAAPKAKTEAQRKADERVLKERKADPAGSYFGTVVRNLLRGTPIGSYIDEIGAIADSGALTPLTMIDRARRAGGMAPAVPKMAEDYTQGLEDRRARARLDDATSTRIGSLPVIGDVTIGGLQKLAGGIASAPLSPMIRALPGTTVLPSSVNAALTGAAYGTAYGAGEGETVDERSRNAGIGGLFGLGLGAVVPGAVKGLGTAAEFIDRRIGSQIPPELRGYAPGAVKRVAQTVEADQIPPNRLRFAMVPDAEGGFTPLGPQGMIADMGQNTSNMAAAIAARQGKGAQTVTQAIRNRERGAQRRIDDAVTRAFGPPQNTVQLEAEAVKRANEAARPYYQQFEQTPIQPTQDITTALRQLRQVRPGKAAIRQASDWIKAEGGSPSLASGRYYDLIKRALDDEIGKAKRAGENNQVRILSDLRSRLVNGVDEVLSPGAPAESPWAKARALAGEGQQYRAGLEAGQKAFDKKTNPDQMRADLESMTGIGQTGFREGARQQVRDIMGNASSQFGPAGGTRGRTLLMGPNARRKVNMIAPAGREGQRAARFNNPQIPTVRGPNVSPNSPVLRGNTSRIEPQRTPQHRTSPSADLLRTADAEAWFKRLYSKVVGNSNTEARRFANSQLPNDNAFDTKGLRNTTSTGAVAEAGARFANFLTNGALNERNARIVADMARMLVAQGQSRQQVVEGLLQFANRRQVSADRRAFIERVANMVGQGARQPAIDQITR